MLNTTEMPRLVTADHDGELRDRAVEFAALRSDGRAGVDVHMLYGQEQTGVGGPAAGLVRYYPGASAPAHRHPGYELIYVLQGEMQSGGTTYAAGSLLTLPPGSVHAPASEEGCLLLVVWEKPVQVLAAEPNG